MRISAAEKVRDGQRRAMFLRLKKAVLVMFGGVGGRRGSDQR